MSAVTQSPLVAGAHSDEGPVARPADGTRGPVGRDGAWHGAAALPLALAVLAGAIAQAADAPVNDDFGAAISISALPFLDTQDLSGASTANDGVESPGPLDFIGSYELSSLERWAAGSGCSMHNTVWYRWTASQDGWYSVDTRLTDDGVDTVIGVYEGSTWEDLVVRQCLNDESTNKNAFYANPMKAGDTWIIQVGLASSADPDQATPVTVRLDAYDYCGRDSNLIFRVFDHVANDCPL